MKTFKTVAGNSVDVQQVSFSKKTKGTDNVEFEGVITGFPVEASGLLTMLQDDSELLARVRINLMAVVEAQAKSTCNRQQSALEEIQEVFEFSELIMAAKGPKKTSKFMVEKLTVDIAEENLLARAARKSGNIEKMDEHFNTVDALEVKLAEWQGRWDEEKANRKPRSKKD